MSHNEANLGSMIITIIFISYYNHIKQQEKEIFRNDDITKLKSQRVYIKNSRNTNGVGQIRK